jgi:A/G-specific adenine glycosylase
MSTTHRPALLAFYDAHKRDLPWRRTKDPYAILVSEVMLQQTRVDTVVAFYDRWMKRFPDVRALSAAPEQTVLAAWSGLGYYRRARNLHAAAKHIVANHGGRVPDSVDGLRNLPGIGPYTAAAVASIAFGVAVAVVDGNVERVVARVTGLDEDPKKGGRAFVAATAQAWLDPSRPGDWNQAMMELGATVCTPMSPSCHACPFATRCEARRRGKTAQIPVMASKRAPRPERRDVVVITRGLKVLVRRRGPGLLEGTWGFINVPAGTAPLADRVHAQTGQRIHLAPAARSQRTRPPARTLEHVFSHRRWVATIHHATLRSRTGGRGEDDAWLTLEEIASPPAAAPLGLSAFDRKVARIVLASPKPKDREAEGAA